MCPFIYPLVPQGNPLVPAQCLCVLQHSLVPSSLPASARCPLPNSPRIMSLNTNEYVKPINLAFKIGFMLFICNLTHYRKGLVRIFLMGKFMSYFQFLGHFLCHFCYLQSTSFENYYLRKSFKDLFTVSPLLIDPVGNDLSFSSEFHHSEDIHPGPHVVLILVHVIVSL